MESNSTNFDLHNQLIKIFFPYAVEARDRVTREKKRFVHYTTAQAAISILNNREIWMRQTSTMNDYMEIEHGLNCLIKAYGHGERRFKQALDKIYEGLSSEVEKNFDQLANTIRDDSYLLCVSEHEADEDMHGRLSMWRAYGKNSGVALVLNPEPFHKDTDVFKAYTTPVAYLRSDEFLLNLVLVAESMEKALELLKRFDRAKILQFILVMLRFAVISAKHKGFSEEQEWRVVYIPSLEKSDHINHAIENIDGVPQEIYKIPIKNIPDKIDYLDMNNVIERVIIGPTQYPAVLYKSFVKALDGAGVQNAHSKVCISDIPLRR